MLAKFLIIIFVLFNPFVFLIGQPISSWLSISELPSQSSSFPKKENQWEEWGEWGDWGKSLISSFWSANPNFLPIRDWNINEPEIEAKAALISKVSSLEPFELDKTLYQKNVDEVLPIASLTKLMTALIVLENLNLEEVVVISEEAVAAYGDMGGLMVNEKISVKNLLYILLMESSNDAAVALAEYCQEKTGKNFVNLMNDKAKELSLDNTFFIDPSGYEPANLSTAKEIEQLVRYSFRQPIIWQILKTPTISLSSTDGQINHQLTNTDELLNRLPNIIGGKTGYTEEAQGCLVLAAEQAQSARLITVVLGAQERFLETEKLIEWVNKAYQW